MGLVAKGGNEGVASTNPRVGGGPPEGSPGQTVTVMITDVFPPLVIMATVQPDGWFDDDIYAQIAEARANARG
jgi:hypothetical protein